MRLGLTYDLQTDPVDERQAEFDPPRTIEALTAALESLGHVVVPIGDAASLRAWLRANPSVDLVFNIAEGFGGRCRESIVPALLEQAGVPYIGSGPAALALGLDKLMAKRLAVACGVSTPRWMQMELSPSHVWQGLPLRHPTTWRCRLWRRCAQRTARWAHARWWDHPVRPRPATIAPVLRADGGPGSVSPATRDYLSFPVILKPRWEGSGIGIDEDAVVYDQSSLEQRAHHLWSRWTEPLLIEAFIDGGELTVLVIGNDPPMAYPPIQRPIDVRTRLACHVVRHSDAWDAPLTLTKELEATACQAAVAVFEAVGCRDMARVDFRVDADGRAWFLEINPLPSFDPEGTFGLLAESLGLTYAQLIGRVLDAAIARNHQSPHSKIQINSNQQ